MRWAMPSAVVIAMGLAINSLAQVPRPRVQPQILKSTAGEDLFRFYCSNCHGLDAKGRPGSTGSHAAAPDLTMLAAANNGVFPRERIEQVIRHGPSATPSHGPTDMPVWGTIFRALEPNDTLVEIRIHNLVEYVESLQSSGRRFTD